MSAEENKEKVRRLLEEALGGGKPALVDELLNSDFVRYDPYIAAGEDRGAKTVKENIVWFSNDIPDLRVAGRLGIGLQKDTCTDAEDILNHLRPAKSGESVGNNIGA